MISVNHYPHMSGSRSFSQPPGAGAPWPGGSQIGPPADPFVSGPPAYLQSQQYPGLVPSPGVSKGPLGLPNLADLKLLIDRMGGIEGILSTVQKVQRIVGTVQQFAPMIKLIAGSLGPKKAAAAASADDGEWRPRRRRRRGGRGRRAGRSRRGVRKGAGSRRRTRLP